MKRFSVTCQKSHGYKTEELQRMSFFERQKYQVFAPSWLSIPVGGGETLGLAVFQNRVRLITRDFSLAGAKSH